MGRALADVTVAADHRDLAGDHNVGGALQTVGQRLAATIEVVELRLGDRVVHVDGRNQQLALLGELVEAMHARGGLLGDAAPSLDDLGPNAGLLLGHALEEVLDDLLLVRAALAVDPLVTLLELIALVDEEGHVATVVDDQLRTLVTGVEDGLEGQLPVLLQRFTLPGEHRGAGHGNGRGGMVLGRKDIARGPTHLGAEVHQRLDEHRRLDGHVQRTGDAHALEGLLLGVLLPDGHQTGHLVLGDGDLLATPVGQRDVADDVVLAGGGVGGEGAEVGQRGGHVSEGGCGCGFLSFGHGMVS